MEDRADSQPFVDEGTRGGITRREAVHRVMAMMGGVALAGGARLAAFSFEPGVLDQAMAQGVGAFSVADVALLDEIADTILPETSTPGAKAAQTGAFMALMVTDAYTDANQRVFRQGLTTLDAACRAKTSRSFMQASPAERLTLLEALDREQKTAMEERLAGARSRAPAAPAPPDDDEARHYFRMMKELALVGYFTSEIGYTKAMRYIEAPGHFDPNAAHAPGDRSWAPHA